MKNKAQVTIFIMLGFIILISLFLFFYIRSQVSDIRSDTNLEKSLSAANELEFLKPYLESCLYKITYDALTTYTGVTGGFIFDPDVHTDIGHHKSNNYTMYDGNGVAFYWNETSIYPNITYIEKNLANYLIINFEDCLNFSSFKDIKYVEKPFVNYTNLSIIGNISFNYTDVPVDIETSINWEDVTVHLVYPLTFHTTTHTTKLRDFIINIPVRVGLMYNKSVEIVKNITQVAAGGGIYNISDNCKFLNTTDYSYNISVVRIDLLDYIIILNEFHSEKKHYENFTFQFAVSTYSSLPGVILREGERLC